MFEGSQELLVRVVTRLLVRGTGFRIGNAAGRNPLFG